MTTKTAPEENPRQRFERLAESRVTKALNSIALVEQLANPQRYQYDERDRLSIEAALASAVEKCGIALKTGRVQSAHFTLGAAE